MDPLIILFGLVDLPAAAIVGPPILVGIAAYALARARHRRARERLAPASQPI